MRFWILTTFACGAVFSSANADSEVSSHSPSQWQKEISAIVPDVQTSRKATLEQIAFRAGNSVSRLEPQRTFAEIVTSARLLRVAKGDSHTTRQQWQLVHEALANAEKLTASPFAADRRQAIEMASWVMSAPESNASLQPQLWTRITDGWILPNLSAAVDDPTQANSRVRLWWRTAELYLSQGRTQDGERCLRASIEVAQSIHLNMADGARYKLANSLEARGELDEAVELLRAITHDATKQGAQKLLAQWAKKHERVALLLSPQS